MRPAREIERWISGLSLPPPPPPRSDAKRKRRSSSSDNKEGGRRQHLLSPPGSSMTGAATPTRKRPRVAEPGSSLGSAQHRREDDDEGEEEEEEASVTTDEVDPAISAFFDVDATPRATVAPAASASRRHSHRSKRPRGRAAGDTSSLSSSSSTPQLSYSASGSASASQRSGASSPRKVMAALELADEPIRQRPLSQRDPSLPQAVRDMVVRIDRGCRHGMGILPGHLREPMGAESDRLRDMLGAGEPLDDLIYYTGVAEDHVVIDPAPSLGDVVAIVDEASLCQGMSMSESTWNSAVHFPLLRLGLHGGPHRRRDARVDFTECSTARIIREYLPSSAGHKMIDFAMFINSRDTSPHPDLRRASARIDALRRGLPMRSINHTDTWALLAVPLAVSIETKRPGRPEEEADLQIMTWQAAQWRMLHDLVAAANAGDAALLDDLPFLPAITVHGHDWRFAACTQDGDKKTLWSDYPFGDTRTVWGAFKIIYGVQRLMDYSVDVFWPWYMKSILHL